MLDFGFYNMDCMEGMKQFPDKYFDLAIVDPPYGINVASHKGGMVVGDSARPFGGVKRKFKSGCVTQSRSYHTFDDSAIPDKKYFDELFRVSKNQIIWGANFMLNYLGNASCMIVWDKARRNLDQADCEIAWTSLSGQSRIFNFKWNGMLQENMKNKEVRIHPTQKPVALYIWLLNNFANKDDVILDTHVGSASSLIACHRTNHKFVGFELDEYYYKMAKERLDAEMCRRKLF
jgi:site-specific DNA-methyltransferase (adenine-specific)